VIRRADRSQEQSPRSVTWEIPGEVDVLAVDTTWAKPQPLQITPALRTVGELELIDLVEQSAARSARSVVGRCREPYASRTPSCPTEPTNSIARG
jgi:hypothetical protein